MGKKLKYKAINTEIIVDNKISSILSSYNGVNKLTPYQIINNILSGKLPKEIYEKIYITNSQASWKKICIILHNREREMYISRYDEIDIFISLFQILIKKSPSFIEKIEHINGIFNLSKFKDLFINDINKWRPKKKKDNFEDLVKYLLCKYKYPSFLLKEFYKDPFVNNDYDGMNLLVHIAQGNSVKSFSALPNLKLSNKCFQHLFTTPNHFNVYHAFRRAQILSMGGDDNLVARLEPTKLFSQNTILDRDEFWVTVVQLFINNSMIDHRKMGEICDYIHDVKYVPNANNRYHPTNSNFTLKGRTGYSILRLSDEWHDSIAKEKKAKLHKWEPYPIKDYEDKTGKYFITQLTTSKHLIEEGRKMHHCVGSYSLSCSNGTCAIFSVRNENNEPLSTIEVRSKSIVQVRSKYNSKATDVVMSHIREWALNEKLKILKYAI